MVIARLRLRAGAHHDLAAYPIATESLRRGNDEKGHYATSHRNMIGAKRNTARAAVLPKSNQSFFRRED
jgi:hypothetical protein